MEFLLEKDIDLLTDTKLSKIEELFIKNKDDNDMLSNIKKIVNNKNLDKKHIQRMVMMMEKMCANELQDLPINKIEIMLSNNDINKYIKDATIIVDNNIIRNKYTDIISKIFLLELIPILYKIDNCFFIYKEAIPYETCINVLKIFFSKFIKDGIYVFLTPKWNYFINNTVFLDWITNILYELNIDEFDWEFNFVDGSYSFKVNFPEYKE